MRILIACGGTGGHIFPGLSLYRALKKIHSDADIILVLDKRATTASIVTEEFPHVYLALASPRFKFDLQDAFGVLQLLKGILQSLKIIIRMRPEVVIGFGGYASFFPVFFSWIFRRKTIIHEANVVPGRANRVLAYLVDKIAIGFAKTGDYFKANSSKVALTGNPLRPNLTKLEKTLAYDFFGFYPNKFTILVMGGSQGAHKINSAFINAVRLMEHKSEFQFIHLCGAGDHSFLKGSYADLGVKARIFAFFSAMEYAYSAADMVISRAGATSISEIAIFGLPLILIPYPYVRMHQVKNARYFKEHNAAILIEEKELSPLILKDKILELFDNPNLRESMSRNILKLSRTQADESLVNLLLNE
ncbi:MAG: undecaprenyldiphospho-muramoylpentapeptide beta-N-acetylglucosaminyltransferase [Candidatus Omnitrophota bacterium]|jgi:UDP-N-acetylglucosamine--N-acetylmuramyl-(pentapeptide) pyrophosphoryl-undecaprenol N-acetylglucosamine transferase